MGEGQQIASFPENNAVNYENNANHFTLVFRPSGRDFNLSLTFLDTQEEKDYYRRFWLEDCAEKTRFIPLAE